MEAASGEGLTEDQIERIVQVYRFQLARYEGAAKHVEHLIRRELRASAISALLSSRAKHPEDVRGKLRVRREDARYRYDDLLAHLNHVMTDLAGCRVVVYDPRQEEVAADVVRHAFRLWDNGKADEVLDKDSGYRATHLLVCLDSKDVEDSLRHSICEVQVTSIACHIFNELSHDIDYKMKGVSPGGEVQRHLRDVLTAARRLDSAVERLARGRAHEIESSKRRIDTSEELRFVLERIIDRPVRGEVEKLHRLLSNVVAPLTAHSLASLSITSSLAAGRERAKTLATVQQEEIDDVIALALGLVNELGKDFLDLAYQWEGPTTALQRAILEVTQ